MRRSSIAAPGGPLSAGEPFALSGHAAAGQPLEVFEDAASIGRTVARQDGQWSLDVLMPAAGPHRYQVRAEQDLDSASLSLTLNAVNPARTAPCTQELSTSLPDGQSVSRPFRLGGRGAGSGYLITVLRGERAIGTRTLPLGAACGWSYLSDPGPGEITYLLRPSDDPAAAPIRTLTLNVE